MADCVYCKQCTAHSLLCVHGSVKLLALLSPRSNFVLESSCCAVSPHYTHTLREEALISIKVACLFVIHQRHSRLNFCSFFSLNAQWTRDVRLRFWLSEEWR